jgi:hypothetical protein
MSCHVSGIPSRIISVPGGFLSRRVRASIVPRKMACGPGKLTESYSRPRPLSRTFLKRREIDSAWRQPRLPPGRPESFAHGSLFEPRRVRKDAGLSGRPYAMEYAAPSGNDQLASLPYAASCGICTELVAALCLYICTGDPLSSGNAVAF